MNDQEFLNWLARRIEEQYGENPNVDFLHRLRKIANETPAPVGLILNERKRQDRKWGIQDHSDLYWLGILMEEVGEVAKDLVELKDPQVEVVQVAAVALAWLERKERQK